MKLFFIAFSALFSGAVLADGVTCKSEGGPVNPAFVQPRPVLIKLEAKDGAIQEFDITPELITRIVDLQAPEFLVSRLYGRNVRRIKELPKSQKGT